MVFLQVEFADHQSVATITITIKDDSEPEGDETSLITLVEVVESGTGLAQRGAVIGMWSYPTFFLTGHWSHVFREPERREADCTGQ